MLKQFVNIDMVEREFQRHLHEDPEMKAAYKAWCDEMGYTTKNGYKDHIQEYLESKENAWDSLKQFEDDF